MKKLRNHSQLKEQVNSPEGANNEKDLYSLTDIEFKKEMVKRLKELRVDMKERRADMNSNAGYFRKELENMRSQEKLENSFAESQAELKALKGRMNIAEERISDLEDRIMEITQSGQQTESQEKKHKSNVRDLCDNIKWEHLHIIGIQEEEEKEKEIENIFEEIMSENFAKLKETDIKITGGTEGPKQVGPK